MSDSELEEKISNAIDFLIHGRVATNDRYLQDMTRKDINNYFGNIGDEEKHVFENVAMEEYLSMPLPGKQNSNSQEDYGRIMFGIYLFDTIADGTLGTGGKMDRTIMPNALQRIYDLLNSQGLDLNDKQHQNIVEYAALVLTWHAPFDESYRVIEKHLDSPLFYELLSMLEQIDIEKVKEINTKVGPDGNLVEYPHVKESPFKDCMITNASVYDYLNEDDA